MSRSQPIDVLATSPKQVIECVLASEQSPTTTDNVVYRRSKKYAPEISAVSKSAAVSIYGLCILCTVGLTAAAAVLRLLLLRRLICITIISGGDGGDDDDDAIFTDG